MRLFAIIGVSLAMMPGLSRGWAEEIAWRPSAPQPTPVSRAPIVTLGQPEMMSSAVEQTTTPTGHEPVQSGGSGRRYSILGGMGWPTATIRGQSPDAPPPPPPSPFGPGGAPTAAQGPAPAPPPAADAYNCGVANSTDAAGGSFWSRCCDGTKQCVGDIRKGITGMFSPSDNRKPFQSDHAFDMMSSPVTNPFFFMDPRSLTEVRPIFMYQHVYRDNSAFNGGNNEFLGVQGRVALTENLSFNISELGLIWMGPHAHTGYPEFSSHFSISEFHFGPQLTFYRNTSTNTIAAGGLTFEIPIGSDNTFQSTGPIGFTPYLSFGQNFLKSEYGSVNFLNTTGWSGGPDRADFFFSSFHFDYNILNQNRFWPMIELNWAAYTRSGNVQNVGFEGWDLFNFGSTNVAGQNELNLSFGGRVKINDFWQVGMALGFNVLDNTPTHIDALRLTIDMIFRY